MISVWANPDLVVEFNPGGSPNLADPGRCVHRKDGVWCADPARFLVRIGCEHEHLTAAAKGVCAEHLDLLRAVLSGPTPVMCARCGHVCRVGVASVQAVAR